MRQFYCKVCGALLDHDDAEAHAATHIAHDEGTRCPHCNQLIATEQLPAHIARYHKDQAA